MVLVIVRTVCVHSVPIVYNVHWLAIGFLIYQRGLCIIYTMNKSAACSLVKALDQPKGSRKAEPEPKRFGVVRLSTYAKKLNETPV